MTMIDMKAVQQALAKAGFSPGPVDGIFGARTRAALLIFQRARGLVMDGVIGPRTLAKLFGAEPGPVSPDVQLPWLAEARRLLGTREGAGAANNPAVLAWANALDLNYPGDDIPWCGLFLAHCFATTLPGEALPENLLGARNWLKFGMTIKPQLGAVMVFWRGSRDGWSGHCALYLGEDATSYQILGGNQSDAVTVTRIAKDRLLGARWPVSVPAPGIVQPIGVGPAQPLSTNEA